MSTQRRRPAARKPKRSLGRRVQWAAMTAVVAGVGVGVAVLMMAWLTTEMGLGAAKTFGGAVPSRSAFLPPGKAQHLAILLGSLVCGVILVKELVD